MRRVTENKLKHILEAKGRNKRKALYSSLPMDVFLVDDEDDVAGSFVSVDQTLEALLHQELIDTLSKAIQKLSYRQREVCYFIQFDGLNMNQISKRLNIPRSTLFDEVLRIREVFRKEGLRDYLSQ